MGDVRSVRSLALFGRVSRWKIFGNIEWVRSGWEGRGFILGGMMLLAALETNTHATRVIESDGDRRGVWTTG